MRLRRSVAVLGFRNLPGRPQDNWLSAAFSEMLNTELSAGGELRMVSGEDVARAKRDLPIADEDSLAKATLNRLHTDPGADLVVLGSYTSLPSKGINQIRLDLRLQDTKSGETISEESVTGTQENLFALASQASARLRQTLGVKDPSPGARETVLAALPSNQKAFRFYAEGRARARAFDFVSARRLLLQAVAADPTYPLAHAALSEAWLHLGYADKARAEAQKAIELSEHLSQEERLLVEGQYRDTIEDRAKAVEAYGKLFELFPDNLQYGLRLASAQRWLKPSDALHTLDALRRLPAPAGDDPSIDLVEASTWINQDFAKAHAAAERAITKGTAQGSQLLLAHAYGILCQQVSTGATSAAEKIASCENARKSYAAGGDRDNEARTLVDFAGLYFQQGDLNKAEAMWREAIPEFHQVGDRQGLGATSSNLGDVFMLQGNLNEARKLLEHSIPDYQAIGDKDGVSRVLNDLGDISRQKGELEAALVTYRQAKATGAEIDDKSAIASILSGMGDALLDQGDLAGARKAYEESLALRKQAGEKQPATESEIALAQLSIEEGHPADAEAAARNCIQESNEEHQLDDELIASSVLINALLAQGKQEDAQKQMDLSQSLAAKSENRLARLRFSLASARILIAAGRNDLSKHLLAEIAHDAHEHGFVGVELENRFLLARLAKNTGDLAAAQEQLFSLEKAARAKGFGLIAGEAETARESGRKRRPV